MEHKGNHDLEQEVFIKDDRHAWISAVVVEKSKTEVVCRVSNGDKRSVKLKEFRKSELPRVNVEMVADLVDMKYLHEPGVLVNLINRHEEGKPYTRSRDVVISINPFRWLHQLYSETNQQFYAKRLVWHISESDPRQDLEPHIYEVSALAYTQMAYQGRNQSIIITGESGSGKTEAAKLMMHHIAIIQLGPDCKNRLPSQQSTEFASNSSIFSDVVDRILNTNPLLEAFGNAMTAQNENSSRFGKYVQLQFDNIDSLSERFIRQEKSNARLVGSYCDFYLLETSRVCIHARNERTYHIFYQLLAASDDQKSSIWNGMKGKSAVDYKYIGVPVSSIIDGKTDCEKFDETLSAFTHIGIPKCDTIMLMQALCIVMQLGNVEFEADPISDDRAVLSTTSEFSGLSDLLGIDSDKLLLAFTQRTMITRNETFEVPLSPSSAVEARDALAKSVYLNAFCWLTDTINSMTSAAANTSTREFSKKLGKIGLLDIFGFESFTNNRFEQLCINYANEKLQQKAISDIFSAVREEYEYEGISLDLVEVVSNEQLLHLFDGRSGIIALLNEESYRPKGSSKAFTAKAIENFKSTFLVVCPKAGVTNQFGIVHYAGTVMYTTDNFLLGNQDTLPLGLKTCVAKCKNSVAGRFQELTSSSDKNESRVSIVTEFPTNTRISTSPSLTKSSSPKIEHLESKSVSIGKKWELAQEKLKSKHMIVSNRKLSNSSPANPNPRNDVRLMKPTKEIDAPSKLVVRQASSSDLMAATVWTKYRAQLNVLLEKLNETHSRYVRCMKPNTSMQPKISDRQMIAKQLRYTGLVSTIILSRSMFTNSIPNKILSTKYRFLWDQQNFPSKAKRMDTNETRRKLDCIALLRSTIKSFGCEHILHGIKEVPYAVGKTRSYFRQGILEWLEATRMREVQKVTTVIQRHVRGRQVRKKIKENLMAASTIQKWYHRMKRLSASLKIQKMYRERITRNRLAKLKRNVLIIQKHVRHIHSRHKMKRLSASLKIQKMYRGLITRNRLAKLKRNVLIIQKHVRHIYSRHKMKRQSASLKIQKMYRGFITRNRLANLKRNVLIIQRHVRHLQSHRTKRLSASLKIQKIYRRHKYIEGISQGKTSGRIVLI